MSLLGAKKKRAQREAEADFRQKVEAWLFYGRNVNHLIVPPEREIPRYIFTRVVEEEATKHDTKYPPEHEAARLRKIYGVEP